MRLLILLILILALSCGVKCANLLQHGPPAGDSSGPTTDKGSVTVPINPGFILYGETYSNLFVNDDAAISFNSPLNKVDLQDNWPLGSNKTVVCLYCADVDVTKGGEIYYQLRTDLNTRAVVADDLKTYTEIPAEFDPAWVFVATWVNVKSFGNNDDEGSGSTFQVVMTTDGNVSVVIFLYDKVTWAIDIERIPGYGDTQTEVKTVGIHLLEKFKFEGETRWIALSHVSWCAAAIKHLIAINVGFNAGDGVKHKIHPSSFSENLLNLPNLNNTKEESGKIIYRVDTEVIVVDTLRETVESTTTASYDTSTPELSPQTTKQTSLGTSTANGETSGTTLTTETSTLETTSTLGTTMTPETITSSETTVTLETTSPETTVPLETTTPSATTVTSETTASEETTEAPETITPSATTVTSETITSPETTVALETTTSSETIMTLETITSPETIVALETTTTSETTTSPQTTVTLETTTSSETTMKSETNMSPETTVTLETTTSSEATMTSEATTSSETTVTLATTMTSEKAVTSEAISNSQTTQSNDIAATETSTKEQTVTKNDTNSQRLTTSQYAAIGVSSAVLVVSAVGIVVIVKIKWSSTSIRKPTHVAPIHSNGQSKPYCEFKIPRPKVRNRVEVI